MDLPTGGLRLNPELPWEVSLGPERKVRIDNTGWSAARATLPRAFLRSPRRPSRCCFTSVRSWGALGKQVFPWGAGGTGRR